MTKNYSKPYVYKVVNKITGQFYVGSQCSGKIIGENYFTSSRNEFFQKDFTQNPQNYQIYILGFFEDPKECVKQENYQIRNSLWMYKELCLNRFCLDPDKHTKIFSMAGSTHLVSKETREKISKANKGKHKKGHRISEETKKKIGIANSKHHPSTELRNRLSNVLKEKYRKDDDFVKRMKEVHKEIGPKVSKAKKGVKQSEERKKLQSKVISKLWENEEYRKHMSEVHKGRNSLPLK